jgi:heme/copper-type cytochrome/quinol oxidase subunit 2
MRVFCLHFLSQTIDNLIKNIKHIKHIIVFYMFYMFYQTIICFICFIFFIYFYMFYYMFYRHANIKKNLIDNLIKIPICGIPIQIVIKLSIVSNKICTQIGILNKLSIV